MAETPRKAPLPKKSPEKNNIAKNEILAKAALARAVISPDLKTPKKSPKKQPKQKNIPPEIPREKIETVRATIKKALEELQKGTFKDAIDAKKIQLKSANYYLAIVIKESSCDPKALSKANAVGYFQLTQAAVEQTNKIFKTRFSHDGVKQDPFHNTLAGILYWHICRDISQKTYDLKMGGDTESLTAFMYNAGPRATCDLAILLKNPKNYKNFEKGLNKILTKLLRKKEKSVSVKVKVSKKIKDEKSKKDKIVIVEETHTYTTAKIIEALHYAKTIKSLRSDKRYNNKA